MLTRRVRDHRDRLIESPDRLWRRIVVLVAAITTAALVVAAILMPHASVLTWITVGAGVGAGTIIAGLISLISKPADLADTRSLTRRGRCGCCRYQIRDLPREADRCTICPECGGAWRLQP